MEFGFAPQSDEPNKKHPQLEQHVLETVIIGPYTTLIAQQWSTQIEGRLKVTTRVR